MINPRSSSSGDRRTAGPVSRRLSYDSSTESSTSLAWWNSCPAARWFCCGRRAVSADSAAGTVMRGGVWAACWRCSVKSDVQWSCWRTAAGQTVQRRRPLHNDSRRSIIGFATLSPGNCSLSDTQLSSTLHPLKTLTWTMLEPTTLSFVSSLQQINTMTYVVIPLIYINFDHQR